MLSVSKKLFERLNEEKIRYCSFKSNEHLEEGLCGDTDLDVLVDLIDYNKVKSILSDLKFIELEPHGIGSYPNVVNWYGYDNKTGKMIHLHMHFELMTGKGLVKEYQFPWGQLFFEKSFCDGKNGVKQVLPQYEYILLCTRAAVKRMVDLSILIKKRTIARDIEVELEYLKKNTSEEDIKVAMEQMYSKEFCERNYECFANIKDLSPKQYYSLVKRIRKYTKHFRRMKSWWALLISLRNRTIRRICIYLNSHMEFALPIRKRCYNGAGSFAFVGIDGSGKSTVSRMIKEWLEKELDIAFFYSGSGDGKINWLSSIMLKLYGRKRRKEASVLSDNKGKEQLNRKYSFIKAFFASIAYLRILKDNIKNLKKSQKYIKKGIVCIMDRYPQNSIEGYHDGAKLTKYKRNRWSIINLFVRKEQQLLSQVKDRAYDMVIQMVVSAEVSFERKPEESLASLQKKVETLRQVKYDAKKIMKVDAEQPLANVVLQVKEMIWEELYLK